MSELAATGPEDRARQMLRLTGRLTELIEQETALFEARRASEAEPLQPEKSRLATIYRRETQLAAKDPARFSGAPEALKAELRAATQAFEAALERNGRVVTALKAVTEGVVKAIADEAARQKTAGSGYGPGAAQTGSLGAMALDRSA